MEKQSLKSLMKWAYWRTFQLSVEAIQKMHLCLQANFLTIWSRVPMSLYKVIFRWSQRSLTSVFPLKQRLLRCIRTIQATTKRIIRQTMDLSLRLFLSKSLRGAIYFSKVQRNQSLRVRRLGEETVSKISTFLLHLKRSKFPTVYLY